MMQNGDEQLEKYLPMGGLPLSYIYIHIPVLARTGKLRRALECKCSSKQRASALEHWPWNFSFGTLA